MKLGLLSLSVLVLSAAIPSTSQAGEPLDMATVRAAMLAAGVNGTVVTHDTLRPWRNGQFTDAASGSVYSSLESYLNGDYPLPNGGVPITNNTTRRTNNTPTTNNRTTNNNVADNQQTGSSGSSGSSGSTQQTSGSSGSSSGSSGSSGSGGSGYLMPMLN